MSSHAGRVKRTQAVEEDATKLIFGDAADGDPLTPAEVKHLLDISRSAPGVPPAPDNKVYKAALEYANEFANFPQDAITSMRGVLAEHEGFLNKFEIGQIIILQPADLDQAFALIPSLDRYEDQASHDRLAEIIAAVRQTARYGAQH